MRHHGRAKKKSGPVALLALPFFFAIAGGTLFLAWKSLKTGARESFSQTFTCPTERVEVRERKDLVAHSLESAPPPPSAEVAADPDRLALWKKTQEKNGAAFDDRYAVFEARGCGHKTLLTCAHPIGSRGTLVSNVSCDERAFPSGSETSW